MDEASSSVCVCVQPVCGSCNVESKGMLEWVVEQCVQPNLTMAALRLPDRDDVCVLAGEWVYSLPT